MICTPYIESHGSEWRRPQIVNVEHVSSDSEDDGEPGRTDEQLMGAVAATGDSDAFAELFHRWHRMLRSYFWRRTSHDDHVAEDLASETFLRLLVYGTTYDSSRPFAPWFWKVARYRLYQHWARRRLPTAPEFAPAEVPSREPDCDARMIADETADAVQSLVCNLPESEFELVRRRYWDGATLRDIAETEGVCHERIRQRLEVSHDAMRKDVRVQYVLFGQAVTLREAVA